MGYNTEFTGILKITCNLTDSDLLVLRSMLGADVREHPEWRDKKGLTYINLELTPSNIGLKWDGSEKTYGMEDAVNLIIREMREKRPDFGLWGEMLAQGEEIGDVWRLKIKDGVAVKENVLTRNLRNICPHCHKEY